MKVLYWIDDTHDEGKPPNDAARRRLEEGLNVQLRVVTLKDREQFGKLLPTLVATETCGVVMDYQLSAVGEGGQMAYGTTWAAEIRAARPSIPVIGISHERECSIPKFRLESFLAFFPREKLITLKPPLRDIAALLSGYNSVYRTFKKKSKKSGVDLMVGLVKPPADVAPLVKAAIPSNLRGQWDEETPHVVGRWLWHDLQGLPGFLFDELGIATHLGLSLKGLERVREKFDVARYRGAFFSEDRPRWWVGAIRNCISQLTHITDGQRVSSVREELLNGAGATAMEMKAMLARPYGRKASTAIPDCVAYKDDEREESDRVQSLFEDTIVDDRDVNSAFGFEPRRVYFPSSKQ